MLSEAMKHFIPGHKSRYSLNLLQHHSKLYVMIYQGSKPRHNKVYGIKEYRAYVTLTSTGFAALMAKKQNLNIQPISTSMQLTKI